MVELARQYLNPEFIILLIRLTGDKSAQCVYFQTRIIIIRLLTMSQSVVATSPSLSLSAAALGQAYEVIALSSPEGGADVADRLAELGFLPGERLAILARGMPGGEPLAVRVGLSTFALRRAEADCVQVVLAVAGAAG